MSRAVDMDLKMNDRGWVCRGDDLMFWVPEDYRDGLTYQTVLIIPNAGRHKRSSNGHEPNALRERLGQDSELLTSELGEDCTHDLSCSRCRVRRPLVSFTFSVRSVVYVRFLRSSQPFYLFACMHDSFASSLVYKFFVPIV